MNRPRPCRPSLKITRHLDSEYVSSFIFEVWSPFIARYQPVESVEAGIQRIDAMANLIGVMRVQRHPRQDLLTDVPEADQTASDSWAEFRISTTTYRSYDTRRNDRPGWVRAAGMMHAAEATCARVGYAIPPSEGT